MILGLLWSPVARGSVSGFKSALPLFPTPTPVTGPPDTPGPPGYGHYHFSHFIIWKLPFPSMVLLLHLLPLSSLTHDRKPPQPPLYTSSYCSKPSSACPPLPSLRCPLGRVLPFPLASSTSSVNTLVTECVWFRGEVLQVAESVHLRIDCRSAIN